MTDRKLRVLIASDVHHRDGIGVEVYVDDQLVMEIFRDDTKKTRVVTVNTKEVPLDLLEESVAIFKAEIPWEFMT